MADYSGTWTLPLWSTSGVLDDSGNHGYTGELQLPLFTSEGSYDIVFHQWAGEWEIPLFEKSGQLVPNYNYTGEFRFPLFEFEGDLKVGRDYTGVWTFPFWEKEGSFGSPYFTGEWRFPMWTLYGRLQPGSLPAPAPDEIDTRFRGWPMNTKNSALTEYVNYPMNSFARFNGEYLGAGPEGLFALDGDDDDGAQIAARVRLALSDLGIDELKRADDAFLSYRSDGTLIFRVVIDGGLTYDYPLEPTGQYGIYTARVKLGQGLKTTYLCFEIANKEGEAFDLDAARVRPIVLSRKV
jgi:hypothetical protein